MLNTHHTFTVPLARRITITRIKEARKQKNSHESLGVKKDKGKHMLLAQVLEKNEFIVFIAYEVETF